MPAGAAENGDPPAGEKGLTGKKIPRFCGAAFMPQDRGIVFLQAPGGLGGSVEEYRGNLQVVAQQEILNGVLGHL